MTQLSVQQKTNIRHFIYYLVNGTLDFELLHTRLNGQYHEILKSNSEVFFKSCCVFINQETTLNLDWPQVKRIAQFICKSLVPQKAEDINDLEGWETNFNIEGNSLESEFKNFSKWFIETPIVTDVSYISYIHDGASFVEQCFAIWANVIELKEDIVLNPEHGKARVIEYIKSYYLPGYKDNLEDWECELHMC